MDEQSIGAIYDQYAPQIYRYIYHRLGNQSLAEDLTSEVFVRLLRARTTPDHLAAYLYRVAHNVIVDYIREHREWFAPLAEGTPTENGNPVHLAEIEIERMRLRRAISRLTPDQQQVIVLKYVEGLSNSESARILDKPEGAIKALQHRALTNLRNLLTTDSVQNWRLEFAELLK